MKKLLLVLAILTLVSVAGAKTYTVTLYQASHIGGAELKPGDYKLDVQDTRIVLSNGRQKVEQTVKVETAADRFGSTTVRYANSDGKFSVREIRLGGTRTKLVFSN